MGGVAAPIIKPIAKVVGLAPKAPAPASAPAAPAAPTAEAASVGQARADREITGALATRRSKRGRASTVLGAADDTAAAQTAVKTLLGQ